MTDRTTVLPARLIGDQGERALKALISLTLPLANPELLTPVHTVRRGLDVWAGAGMGCISESVAEFPMPSWVSWKSFLWLAGVLAVGALSNGVWELAVKPAGGWLLTAVLNLSTLGFSSARDSLYVQVAKGRTDAAAIYLLALTSSAIGGITAGLATRGRALLKPRPQRTEPESIRIQRKRKTHYFVALTSGSVIAVVIAAQTFQMLYVSLTIARLEQMQKIIAPYTPESDRIKFAARIASMQGQGDYDAVVADMLAIAKANGANLKAFTPPI